MLAPHYSAYSVGQYLGRAGEAAEPHGVSVAGVESWATEPAFVDFLVHDLGERLAAMPDRTRVLFTAHSLPERILTTGDPYPDELRATAEAVAARLQLTEGDDWQIAWQSAGRTPEPWLGPDILDVIDALGDDPEVDGVVVSAVGFVADHLEVLYDLDIEARQRARAMRPRLRSHRLCQRRHGGDGGTRRPHPRGGGVTTPPRVLVVGGGIAGLAAAVDLVDDPAFEVEVWEADDRLGGKIATSPFAGLDHIDEAADAYLTRVPHAVAFAERVGLRADDLTAPTGASAMVWHDRLHDIPGGILLGVPAAIRPLITTSLLSWRGKLRAAIEPLLPGTDPDDSLGRLVRARFGDEVHDRLVDSLIGSIYATDTDRSSLTAVPQLAELAANHRSLLLGGMRVRRRAPAASPGITDLRRAPARYGETDRRRRRPRSQPWRVDRHRPRRHLDRTGRSRLAGRRRTVRRRGTGVSGASHGSDPVRRLSRSG